MSDEAQLNAVLQATSADVLVLSAHGRYSPAENSAMLMIGNTASFVLALEHVPPLVILSACHVAPRATGAVTVADLLFRLGAHAVIGTLVPINAVRNSYLMNRFFVYLCDTIDGVERSDTLESLWHWVLSLNAVHDICSASGQIQKWAFSSHLGMTVDEEFKNVRSKGRLRGAHIYRDTERVLMEMARERDFGSTLGATLKSVGYIPESIFYVLLGRADRLILSRDYEELLAGRRAPGSTVGD